MVATMRAGTGGAADVLAAARGAQQVLSSGAVVVGSAGSRAEWAAALGVLQEVADVVAAAQDAAIVQLAAIEPECREDGTVVESRRAPGHAALDAPSIVSGVLNVSAVHAERRVAQALRVAADGPDGSGSASGMGGLHTAMAAGCLDAYRAGVLAHELEGAPPEVAASVVAAVEPWFGTEDAPRLRRRCRRVLARLSPDLLRQRAVRARAGCSLRRWVDEPGVDTWRGTFPSEDAAAAWAAVDALAQRYVTDGRYEQIERARAAALTDLVAGTATVEVQVTLTAPASVIAVPSGRVLSGPVPGGPVPGGPAVPAARVSVPAGAGPAVRADTGARAGVGPGTPARGPAEAVSEVTSPAGQSGPACRPDPSSGPLRVSSVGGAGDLVEVAGLHPGDPVLVSRAWLQAALDPATSPGTGPGSGSCAPVVTPSPCGPAPVPSQCDPGSGALVDPGDTFATQRYRPGRRLAALVRARDGHCRFPGCHVAARFCDLDHIRPWPAGPTSAGNLATLCRRHHRIKQRPGWSVRIEPDATLHWSDPTGRQRTTLPIDHLHLTALPARCTGPGARTGTEGGMGTETRTGRGTDAEGRRAAGTGCGLPPSRARLVLPDGPHSVLEHYLEHHPPPRRWNVEYLVRKDHHHRRCLSPPGDPPF